MGIVRVKGYTVKGGRKSTEHSVDSHYRKIGKVTKKDKYDREDEKDHKIKKRKRNMFGL